MSVADQHGCASSCSAARCSREPLLIRPREVFLVIAGEAAVRASHCISRIAVDHISSSCTINELLKVTRGDACMPQYRDGRSHQSSLPQRSGCSVTSSVGHIEPALLVHAIHAAESGAVQIEKPRRPPKRTSRGAPANALVLLFRHAQPANGLQELSGLGLSDLVRLDKTTTHVREHGFPGTKVEKHSTAAQEGFVIRPLQVRPNECGDLGRGPALPTRPLQEGKSLCAVTRTDCRRKP